VKILQAGDGFYVPAGVEHHSRAIEACRIAEVYTPPGRQRVPPR
jgi:quercetin dioxygenase-like cupin family protein